jgi:galactose oxidase
MNIRRRNYRFRFSKWTVLLVTCIAFSVMVLATPLQRIALSHSGSHSNFKTATKLDSAVNSQKNSLTKPLTPALKPGTGSEHSPKPLRYPLHVAQVPPTSGNEYLLVAQHSGKCVDIDGFSTQNGGNAQQFICNKTTNQTWTLQASGEGFLVVSKNSNKCLDVSAFSTEDRANVYQWDCNNTANQIWKLQPVGNGYSLVSQNSNKCLDVSLDVPGNPDGANIYQFSCANTANQTFAFAEINQPANLAGRWSSVIDFPSIPVGAAVLPNVKVVTWASWDRQDFNSGTGQREKTYTALFDPGSNQVEEALIDNTNHDMFCPGVAMLADGRLLVSGGGPDTPRTSIYDFGTNQWTNSGDMNIGRWYNTAITLPNGNVYTLGGNRSSANRLAPGEIWNAASGAWSILSGITTSFLQGFDRSDEYPRMFVAPDGRIFVAGATPTMHWLNLSGSGSQASAGPRGSDPYAQNSVNVMYAQGKILKVGGADQFTGGTPSDTVYSIDINNGVETQQVASLGSVRVFANGVVLPDGKVLVVGGNTSAVEFSDAGTILTPELWNPDTEQWTPVEPHARPRNYHSVALLLPDGRVFAGGGGLCGPTCGTNHPNAEIYSPPYLFSANGQPADRPVINVAPDQVGYNGTINAQISSNAPITKFNLIRLSSVTHSTSTDQRALTLSFNNQGGQSYAITAPANANLAPPGYYMLFALTDQGVPSISKIMQIQ